MNLKAIYKPFWNPYICGILIALLQIPAYFILKTSLGTSRAFSTVACLIQSLFDQGTPAECLANIKNYWQLGLVIGIVIGAYLAKRLTNASIKTSTTTKTIMPSKTFPKKQALLGFIGGVILILGTHLGTGCTSGNGISGISLLYVGSFIVIACMFIGGVITAYFLSKRGLK